MLLHHTTMLTYEILSLSNQYLFCALCRDFDVYWYGYLTNKYLYDKVWYVSLSIIWWTVVDQLEHCQISTEILFNILKCILFAQSCFCFDSDGILGTSSTISRFCRTINNYILSIDINFDDIVVSTRGIYELATGTLSEIHFFASLLHSSVFIILSTIHMYMLIH